jgi:hypothetical protein
MKSIYLHVFYLTIIAFLGYNYWSSVQAFKAFEHLDRQLNVDYEIMNNFAIDIHQKIDKTATAYPNSINKIQHNKAAELTKNTDTLMSFINSNKNELISLNGGMVFFNNAYSVKNNSVNPFSSSDKINEIKAKLQGFSQILLDSIKGEVDRKRVQEQLYVPKLLSDNSFWHLMTQLPANGALAKLSLIQNKIKTDEIIALNYQYNSTDIPCWGSPTISKTMIVPKKAVLFENEVFEADIYLVSYSVNYNSNITIKVNGKPLEMKEGVTHFKGRTETVGIKTIKAEAFIRNSLTGQIITTEGSFEYQVLPKCSRDCQ